jgi:hypothetical protein
VDDLILAYVDIRSNPGNQTPAFEEVEPWFWSKEEFAKLRDIIEGRVEY